MEHTIVGVWDIRLETDAEVILEEGSLQDDNHKDDGGQGEVQAISDGESEDLSEIPTIWSHGWQDTIDRESHDGSVVKEGNDQNHEGWEVELVREGEDGEADDDTDGDGAGVDRIVPHTLENDTGTTNGVNDGGETGFSQDDIGSTTGGIGGTLDSDTDIGTGQGGGIVGTITGHGTKVAEALETLNDLVLVFREDTSETVGIQDHIVEGGVFTAGGGAVLQNPGGIHVVAQAETTSGFLRNGELITGNHFDPDTESNSIVNGLLGVFTGRVEDGEETDELETVALSVVIITLDFLKGDSQGTETAHSEFLNIGFEPVLDILGLVSGAKLDDDAGHTLGDTLKLAGGFLTVGALGTLVDGVEWFEVEDLDTGVSPGRIRKGTNDTSVDGVLVFGTGSVGSQFDDILEGEWAVSPDGGAIDGELVGGEGTGLV